MTETMKRVWKILASDGYNNLEFGHVFKTRWGVIWFLLTHWKPLPVRFSIFYQKPKPILRVNAKASSDWNVFCAEDTHSVPRP